MNGLIPKIRTVVARYREDQPRSTSTFENLVQYARDEFEAYRERAPNGIGGSRPVLKTGNRNVRTVTVKEPSSCKGTLLYALDGEGLYHVEYSIDMDLLPQNETLEDKILYVQEGRENE